MIQYKDLGIILKSQDFFEADKILNILTQKKGKIRAIAKGIRRPTARFSGNLEPFSCTNLILVEGRKDLDIITGAEIISGFKNIKKDLKKTATAYLLVELVDGLIGEKEKQLKVFENLRKALEKLDSDKGLDLSLLKDYFIINTLDTLGYRPEIKICQLCNSKIKENKNYFSFKLGGVLCSSCFEKDEGAAHISLENLKILKLFVSEDIDVIDKIEPKNKKELSEILELFLEYISEKTLKSSKFYKHINHKEN